MSATRSRRPPEKKIIYCTDCGSIHPLDAQCKPWGDVDV